MTPRILSVARRFWRGERDHPDVAKDCGPVMLAVLKTVAAEKDRE